MVYAAQRVTAICYSAQIHSTNEVIEDTKKMALVLMVGSSGPPNMVRDNW